MSILWLFTVLVFKKQIKQLAVEIVQEEQSKVRPHQSSSNNNLINKWYFFEIDLLDCKTVKNRIRRREDQEHYIPDFWALIHFFKFRNGSFPKNLQLYREEAFFEQGEQEAWCEENCSGRWIRLYNRDKYIYGFEKGQDAIAFKIMFNELISPKGSSNV